MPPVGPDCGGCGGPGPRSPLSVQLLFDLVHHSLFCMKFQCEKMDFVSLLLLFFSAVAVSRAQVQQEPSAETSEGTGINITCSHPNIQTSEYIHWYRQLPGRGPAFLVSAVKGSKEVPDPRGGAVGVGRPALQRPVARPAPSRGRGGVLLRRGPTGRRAAAAAGHEPLWAGRGHSAVRACRGRCLQGRQTPS